MARAIHRNSPRSEGPFVELNCAAIPETLFEKRAVWRRGRSPLERHAAARRARSRQPRAARSSSTRSVSCPRDRRPSCCSSLQSREYYPLGASKPKHANVRIISATNVDLKALVAERRFREDLFYRLNVVPLEMPPLSARVDDVPILVEYLCQQACRAARPRTVAGIPRDALTACREATWPGNVRELDNAVQKAVIHANGQKSTRLEVRHLFPEKTRRNADARASNRVPCKHAMRSFQRRFVEDALETHEWNVAETARQLGIVRSHLYNLIKDPQSDPQGLTPSRSSGQGRELLVL